MGLAPLEQLTQHLDPWLGENLNEREAIDRLRKNKDTLKATDVELAASFVIGLGNHVWLWRDWPDYIRAVNEILDELQQEAGGGTKGWGRFRP